jgi:hypothetical protein
MLASTPAGDAYSLGEYRRLFAAVGFSEPVLHPLPPTPQQALVATA